MGDKMQVGLRLDPDVMTRFEVIQRVRRRSRSAQVSAWVDAEFKEIVAERAAIDRTKAAEAERLLLEE